MKNYFSIGEAAKAVNMTSETLRHYDRIGLVKPSKKDECTNYRYYTQQDIVRLNTVRALQQMDMPLQKIKEVLEYDDIHKMAEPYLKYRTRFTSSLKNDLVPLFDKLARDTRIPKSRLLDEAIEDLLLKNGVSVKKKEEPTN